MLSLLSLYFTISRSLSLSLHTHTSFLKSNAPTYFSQINSLSNPHSIHKFTLLQPNTLSLTQTHTHTHTHTFSSFLLKMQILIFLYKSPELKNFTSRKIRLRCKKNCFLDTLFSFPSLSSIYRQNLVKTPS